MPITLSVVLVVLDVLLMVFWIILLARERASGAAGDRHGRFLGDFVRHRRLHGDRRQGNPPQPAAGELRRQRDARAQIADRHACGSISRRCRCGRSKSRSGPTSTSVMEGEVQRLSNLINQLLEVGRLDAIGQRSEPVDVPLEPLLAAMREVGQRPSQAGREPGLLVRYRAGGGPCAADGARDDLRQPARQRDQVRGGRADRRRAGADSEAGPDRDARLRQRQRAFPPASGKRSSRCSTAAATSSSGRKRGRGWACTSSARSSTAQRDDHRAGPREEEAGACSR